MKSLKTPVTRIFGFSDLENCHPRILGVIFIAQQNAETGGSPGTSETGMHPETGFASVRGYVLNFESFYYKVEH